MFHTDRGSEFNNQLIDDVLGVCCKIEMPKIAERLLRENAPKYILVVLGCKEEWRCSQ
jgi:hypothetical protein